jgi:hypothetical protein
VSSHARERRVFVCVCLSRSAYSLFLSILFTENDDQVATNELPYAHRRNDRAVTIDILRGVRPCRGAPPVPDMRFTELQEEAFWGALDRCWDAIPPLRPTMTQVEKMMGLIAAGSRVD